MRCNAKTTGSTQRRSFSFVGRERRKQEVKDIAETLGVTSNTVRKWKANDIWEGKIERERSFSSGCSTRQSKR
nr:phage terminase small subunit-related protein [Bacillus mojavensis]